jgi:hypothetical protein
VIVIVVFKVPSIRQRVFPFKDRISFKKHT